MTSQFYSATCYPSNFHSISNEEGVVGSGSHIRIGSCEVFAIARTVGTSPPLRVSVEAVQRQRQV